MGADFRLRKQRDRGARNAMPDPADAGRSRVNDLSTSDAEPGDGCDGQSNAERARRAWICRCRCCGRRRGNRSDCGARGARRRSARAVSLMRRADIVLSTLALGHLRPVEAAMAEMARIAAPGAIVLDHRLPSRRTATRMEANVSRAAARPSKWKASPYSMARAAQLSAGTARVSRSRIRRTGTAIYRSRGQVRDVRAGARARRRFLSRDSGGPGDSARRPGGHRRPSRRTPRPGDFTRANRDHERRVRRST